jgi:hypothetical protein
VYHRKKLESLKENDASKEIDYFNSTGHILFEYYNSLENTNDKKSTKKGILDFFNDPAKEEKSNNDTDINDPNTNRVQLIEKYLSKVDENYVDNNICTKNVDACGFCGSTAINFVLHEGLSFCTECNSLEFIIADNDKPSYKEPPKQISYFSYKRINHFTEWVNQIQGKETTDIPDEVFDKILLEFKKQKITNMATVTQAKIKELLKKLRINKYYEHSAYIAHRITGIPNPHLSAELEEQLRNMFKEIQVPFFKHSPRNRKNFLSYSYCLHKILQLLGEDKYLKHFPLLKSRMKLYDQEVIWKKICMELNWSFIPSI